MLVSPPLFSHSLRYIYYYTLYNKDYRLGSYFLFWVTKVIVLWRHIAHSQSTLVSKKKKSHLNMSGILLKLALNNNFPLSHIPRSDQDIQMIVSYRYVGVIQPYICLFKQKWVSLEV